MKKRYIVLVNSSTEEAEEKFLEFIRMYKLGWWHWFPNVWLISDKTGKLSASSIRDFLKVNFNPAHNLVLEISDDDDTWSGFGTKTGEKDMFKWIKKNWNKK